MTTEELLGHSPFPIGEEAKEARAIAREYRCPIHGRKVRLSFDYDRYERICDIYIKSCCKGAAQSVANSLAQEGFDVTFHWSLIGD